MRALAITFALLGMTAPAAAQQLEVIVNHVRLTPGQLVVLSRMAGQPPRSGRYWYDGRSGAWGIEGGPALGQLPPNLGFGGPLRADASKGKSGVYINGRQLTRGEVAQLSRLGTVFKRRYWLDANGTFGFEGGPALGNLVALMKAKQRTRPITRRSPITDAGYGSDGNGNFYIQGGDFSYSNF